MMLNSKPAASHVVPIYGCFNTERSAPTTIAVQDGWIEKPFIHPLLTNTMDDLTGTRLPVIKLHRSAWKRMSCGHTTRQSDKACDGCRNQFDAGDQLPLPQFN